MAAQAPSDSCAKVNSEILFIGKNQSKLENCFDMNVNYYIYIISRLSYHAIFKMIG